MLVEASFRERRRTVLRAEGLVLACAVLGLGLVALVKGSGEAAVETAIACFVISVAGAMLNVWQVANRHWRCPACDVRWETRDTLASFQWNHCPSCGEALRAFPRPRDHERAARIAFEAGAPSHDQLVRDFERRNRRGAWLAGLAAAAGLVAMLWVSTSGLGETVEHAVVAGFGAAVAGSLVWGARCPRCRTGVIARGRHCQRCGLSLDAVSESADPRTAR